VKWIERGSGQVFSSQTGTFDQLQRFVEIGSRQSLNKVYHVLCWREAFATDFPLTKTFGNEIPSNVEEKLNFDISTRNWMEY